MISEFRFERTVHSNVPHVGLGYDNRVTSKFSVCSQGGPVSYYWRFCTGGGHIEQTSSRVVETLQKAGYVLTGYAAEICEAEIEDRLELAERGGLKPVEHVKRIQRSPEVDMFEIRWNHIMVMEQDRVSGEYQDVKALIRLYYFEQGEPWVVGLHLHEKVIVDGDEAETSRLQNVEIDQARECFEQCRESRWGLDELSPLRGGDDHGSD